MDALTNIVVFATLSLSLQTNSHDEPFHPSGQIKRVVDVVTEQHVITYAYRGLTNVVTNTLPYGTFSNLYVSEWRLVTNPPAIAPPVAKGFFPPVPK